MTLMVGGPMNGEDCTIPHEQRLVRVPVQKPSPLNQLAASLPTIEESTYRLERVVLFGRVIPIWLHESIRTDGDACHKLLKLLLNEQGWEIWSKGEPR